VKITDLLTPADILAVKDACRRVRAAGIKPLVIEIADNVFVEDRAWGGWRYRLQNRIRYSPPTPD